MHQYKNGFKRCRGLKDTPGDWCTVPLKTPRGIFTAFSPSPGRPVRAHRSDSQVRAGTAGSQSGELPSSGGRAGGRAPRGHPGGRISGEGSRPGPAGGLQAGAGEGGLPVGAGRPAQGGQAEREGGWEAEAAAGEHHPGLGAQQPKNVHSGF